MALIDNVKLALRIKSSSFDDELQNLIDACKVDMNISGVEVISETEPLTERAIIFYCKGNFGYDDKAEKFQDAYEKLKIAMSLSGDYKNEVV